jgi:hypothetical protein
MALKAKPGNIEGHEALETVLKPLTSQKMFYYERQTKGNF